jgi:hypothetical protein
MIDVKFVGGKYVAVIDGKTVKRSKKEHMDYVIRQATKGKTTLAAAAFAAPVESKFTINQRFGFVSDMVMMLSKGDQASVIVTGPGGLGKSFTVTKALADSGLKDVSVLDDYEVGSVLNSKKTFRVIKGYSTPKGLYRTLYENRDSVIVFDDCDSVLRDPVSLNLLKGALDSYSRRIISWRADFKDEDLPNCFEFKGRVVFISNLPSHAMDQAILTRSMTVDLTMTNQQKVERMFYLLQQKDFMPEYEMPFKVDAMRLIEKLQDSVKELSLRTLIQVTKIRKANANNNWENLAEYVLTN